MPAKKNPITVFSKPWKDSIPELGKRMQRLGVDGIELPVRPGYPVTPDNMAAELPQAARELAGFGLKIYSVAGTADAATVAACGAAGIPILRICVPIDMKIGYLESVKRLREELEQLLPELERHGVAIGLQNHCDYCIGSAVGIMHAIADFDPQRVAAVLDVAHCGLDGEPDDMAVDITWSHLCMVNFKNSYRRRVNGPEAEEAVWQSHWTIGRHGFASWSKTAAVLKERGYQGPICLTAEYSAAHQEGAVGEVDRLIALDVAYARELFG